MSLLSPLIILVCAIGAFSMNNNPVDILIMMSLGGLGYLMKKFDYDPAPLMLGCVLGPLLEKAIRQSLIISRGSLSIFVVRPISRILVGLLVLLILLPILKMFLKRGHPIPAAK
jgi:putative tricarboxylic transport membrane protein